MIMKRNKSRSDDLSYWNVKKPSYNTEMKNVDDEEQSIALSVSLLLKNKNISSKNLIQLPSHVITSPKCQCHRSFHIFCTDLFHANDQDTKMINIQPAPHCHDRDSSRRILTSHRKYRHEFQEDNVHDTIGTTSSEFAYLTSPESQSLEKKSRISRKVLSRNSSLNTPMSHYSFQRSLQTPAKYSSSIRRLPKQLTSIPQLQVRALSLYDQSSSESQVCLPRTPPSSPKTPRQDSPMISLNSINPAPLQVLSITPRVRNFNENEKKLTNISSVKIPNYEDYAREYLSASDDDKDTNKILSRVKPQLSICTESLSRPGTAFSVRLLLHNSKRNASAAKVHYMSSDVQKNFTEKSRQISRSQTRLMEAANENDDASTAITKTTAQLASIPQMKSVFGFPKTSSSMHFGFAADRLGLQGSFEKWPRPLSRRTSIERKLEVTTLRLVTLPLVTS